MKRLKIPLPTILVLAILLSSAGVLAQNMASNGSLVLSSMQTIPSTNPIHEYTIPTNNSGPLAIISGGNNTYWFTEFGDPNGGKIGEYFSAYNSFKEYQVPENGSRPAALTKDSFGNIWFSDQSGTGSIWKLDPATDQFTQYKTLTTNSTPLFVLVDPKTNNVWFTEITGNKIGELVYPSYSMTEYTPPTSNSGPAEMTLNGSTLWITETYASQIATFNINTHSFQEFKPTVSLNSPIGIVLGGSGDVWISEHGGSSIVEYNPANSTWKKFPTSPPSLSGYDRSAPATLAIDNNGILWFVEHYSNEVGRLNPQTDQMNEFVIPTLGAYSVLNAVDSSGNFWFTQFSANQIGEIPGNTSSLVSLQVDGALQTSVQAGQSLSVNFLATNSYSQPILLTLNSSSTFSSSGVTSVGGITLNSTNLELEPGQSSIVQATITPSSSLSSGLYTIGVVASYGNSSTVGYAFLNIQNNSLVSIVASNLPFIGIIIVVALIVGLFAVRRLKGTKKSERQNSEAGKSIATITLLGTLVILATILFAPSVYSSLFKGVLIAQGKCPGIPYYQNKSPDWFTYLLDAATVAVIGFLIFLLIRDYRRGKFKRSKEESADEE
ncbi:MAG: Vgb family protein [Nitrososphaerales archaeon]